MLFIWLLVRISIHLMLLFIGLTPVLVRLPYLISIHLMLLFISGLSTGRHYGIISIHLMLLFIIIPSSIAFLYQHFNTSHVTVYRRVWIKQCLFIQFQYISCYCLSLAVRFLSSFLLHFNTSHVTVYLPLTKYSTIAL